MKLTVRSIQSLKPDSAQTRIRKISLGDGLYLYLSPKGKKTWTYRYMYKGKPKDFRIGDYPEIPIASYHHAEFGEVKGVKQRLEELKVILSLGKDPSQEKKASRQGAKQDLCFETLAYEWAEKRKREITSYRFKIKSVVLRGTSLRLLDRWRSTRLNPKTCCHP